MTRLPSGSRWRAAQAAANRAQKLLLSSRAELVGYALGRGLSNTDRKRTG
jgi:hypothetical protein